MTDKKDFDVIIVGGSYSGLAAAMALGRALRKVLIIDSGKPCNRQTPHSHNFLTQDGKTPSEIATLAREQVLQYPTVRFFNAVVTHGARVENGFEIHTATGESFRARKLIFATGIRDIMPPVAGFAECWGISVLHCPYCHGYEVRHRPTGILADGDVGFELSTLISNWTQKLTLFTNGTSALTPEQQAKLQGHSIKVVEKEIESLAHVNGQLQRVVFKDGSTTLLDALYARAPFEQHCKIPQQLGCELTDDGYIQVDPTQKTSVSDVFACGDNTTRVRTVANAVAMGTTTGIMVNRELVFEDF